MTMSATGVSRTEDRVLAGMLVLSVAAHLVTMRGLPEVTARQVERRVELAFYEPPPAPAKVEVQRPIVKVKAVVPQRPHVEALREAQPIAGISRSSTTETGLVVVPVGNTSLWKAEKVVESSEVLAYSAPKYAPPGSADTEPVPLGEVKVPYPEVARENEIEGSVLLNVTVDASGAVTAVSVIRGPGYGLNEAAREAMKRFKFRPAMKGGEAVGTSLVYTYTFALE